MDGHCFAYGGLQATSLAVPTELARLLIVTRGYIDVTKSIWPLDSHLPYDCSLVMLKQIGLSGTDSQ